MSVSERFIRYTKIDTQSSPVSGSHPSSKKQFDLANVLMGELKEMGLDPVLDEHCYLYVKLPENKPNLKKIGFIAHLDTEPVVSGTNVDPQIVDYKGGDIVLKSGAVISVKEFPELENYIGEEIITTDGTTLLGADDKAGVAEIMELLAFLTSHPEVKHGSISVAFTPDEEIGEGADYFNVPLFGAEFAYTVDGGPIGEISYETFNAASASFTFHGRNIHPGLAKGKMLNCCLMVGDLLSRFPQNETPATTDGREGFYHIDEISSGIEEARVDLIIRDHDMETFEKRKKFALNLGNELNQKYGEGSVSVSVKDSYYNMAEMIKPHMHLIENAEKAVSMTGTKPFILAVRGGTDGSRLSFMGLPCPNLGTGQHNCHSILEFVSIPSLLKGVEVLKNIVALYAEEAK